MRNARWMTGLALLGAVTLSNAEVPSERDWNQADEATVRLAPSGFSALSVSVRQDLERRGCTIPQDYGYKTPHNVIRGRFTSSAEEDVAVLCSKERVSSILVFRGGSPANVVELARGPDKNFLQAVGDPKIGFSRMIAAASQKVVRTYREKLSEPEPIRSLSHDGIEDIFDGKGSVVWYWNDGRWLELPGAD